MCRKNISRPSYLVLLNDAMLVHCMIRDQNKNYSSWHIHCLEIRFKDWMVFLTCRLNVISLNRGT